MESDRVVNCPLHLLDLDGPVTIGLYFEQQELLRPARRLER